MSFISLLATRPGCRPARIVSTISGARKLSSQQPGHVPGGDLLGHPNLFEAHISGGLDSAWIPAGANKEPDEGIGRTPIEFARDDEPQLRARPLELGRDRQQDGMIVIAIMGSSERGACVAGPCPVVGDFASVCGVPAQQLLSETTRVDLHLDTIGENLNASQDGALLYLPLPCRRPEEQHAPGPAASRAEAREPCDQA